jgi:hypothetical protein
VVHLPDGEVFAVDHLPSSLVELPLGVGRGLILGLKIIYLGNRNE